MLLGVLLLTSCINDETTNGDGVISVIKIDPTSLQDVYDIDKNETLVIEPRVTQEGIERDLTYTWEIDQKTFSNDVKFTYVGDRLGTFKCRLIVENEDGKDFYPFTLNVNSPYEQGYTMISVDEEGNSMISFMMTDRKDGIEEHFAEGDCFRVNNADETFASNVADIVHCDGTLILACKGSNPSSDPGTIYYLNDKTLVVENKLSTSEYPDFKPMYMAIPAYGSAGVSYPILSEDGKVYEFSTAEGVLNRAVKLQHTYASKGAVYSGSSASYYALYFWENEIGALAMIMNGYGPYYCSTEYLCERHECEGAMNYFNGVEFVTMCIPQQERNNVASTELVVITKNASTYQKARLDGTGLWAYNADLQKSVLHEYGKGLAGIVGKVNLTAESPIIGSGKYLAIMYADGNAIYRWNYTTNQRIEQAPIHAKVGSDNAVVTSMTLSENQEQLYIAFYEPQEKGLNGYVWVVNTDTGELIKKYDNVGYRPVKLIYKKK